jgi:preprotein translocase subunit SecF
MHILKHTNIDFLRWRWHALVLSWVVILGGLAVIATKGLPLGVEFSGGTIVIVEFDKLPAVQDVRAALDREIPGAGQNAVIQRYGDPSRRQIMVRVPEVGAESGGSLSQAADKVVAALKKSSLGSFTVAGTEIIGPVVGKDLTQKGILATVLSLAGILLYIAFRFRLSFAVGAVVATVHDLLVTLAFLSFFRYDLTLNVIAAILTVTGYSTNDTIVIFDRVRENLKSMRRDSLNQVINTAVNQTLGRTVITAGTTLLSAISLFVFGGEVLRGFAFTLIVGVVTGTYSSVFIAAAIVTFWRGRAQGAGKATSAAPDASRKAVTDAQANGARPSAGQPSKAAKKPSRKRAP